MADAPSMDKLNKALKEVSVATRHTCTYPVHVRYTKRGDVTHFKNRTRATQKFGSAVGALDYCLQHPDIVIACIFDAKGKPVDAEGGTE